MPAVLDPPPRLISVDPGCGITAAAYWVDGALVSHARIRRPKTQHIKEYIDSVGGRSAGHLIVEGQWLGNPARGASPHHDVIALACQRRTWEVVSELAGWTTEVIPPTWISAFTRGGPMCADHGRERDSVRRLIFVARLTFPALAACTTEPDPNEWAAIMLGQYWLIKRRRGEV